MKNSTIVSADVKIGDRPGFAVIEILDNGIKIFIERYYPTISEIEVLVAVFENREKIIKIYNDWGDYYDSIPKMEQSIK